MKRYYESLPMLPDIPSVHTAIDIGRMIKDPDHVHLFGTRCDRNGTWVDVTGSGAFTNLRSPPDTPLSQLLLPLPHPLPFPLPLRILSRHHPAI